MANLRIEPSGQSCGARVTGVDLSDHLDAETVAAIRQAWLRHLVLCFPDQQLDDDARFVYRLRWEAGMLGLWDNRALLHRATGGYDGHRRLLHRITVAAPKG